MMTSRIDKTERLLNLTLALLATKRPKTKNEILCEIPGYTGSSDAMERMFERDKDELRALGVNIEVLPVDAYFEDELGYQIIPRDFFLPEITFTFEESIWLALATNLLSEISVDERAQQGLQKILTYSKGPIDEILDFGSISKYQIPFNHSLDAIWRSIKDKTRLQFIYSSQSGTKFRLVSPLILTSRLGNWYLVAFDSEDKFVKTFRIDRMLDITINTEGEFHEPPKSFNLDEFLAEFRGDTISQVQIRLHRELPLEHPLVARAKSIAAQQALAKVPAGEIITIENIDRSLLLEMALWAGDSVEVVAPKELRIEMIRVLERIIQVNI